MTSRFYEEDNCYAVLDYSEGKTKIFVSFRDGNWYINESSTQTAEAQENSFYYNISGFSGPVEEYLQEYNSHTKKTKIAGELLDSLIFGVKNDRDRN